MKIQRCLNTFSTFSTVFFLLTEEDARLVDSLFPPGCDTLSHAAAPSAAALPANFTARTGNTPPPLLH